MSEPSTTVGEVGIRGFERGVQAAALRRELDASQSAVLALPDGVSAAVIGAPGTGKTTTLIELVADRVHSRGWSTDELLVLSPTRAAATELRDRLAIRLGTPTLGPLARTANSLAYQLVQQGAAVAGLPTPRLLTGAEQDRIIAELIAGSIEDGSGPAWPEPLGEQVRRLRGFRTELRELMMRAVEYGLHPAELARLGRDHGRPQWSAAADFIVEYQQVVSLFRGRYFDSAELVREAAGIVAAATADALGRIGRLRLILIDDAQELTESTLGLLRSFTGRGVQVIAFGDPDIATATFRGAKPEALARLGGVLGLADSRMLVLREIHRHGPGLSSFVGGITARIGTAGAGIHRRPGNTSETDSAVVGVLANSAAEEIALIAWRLRERHVFDGVPWSDMAVIVRNGSLAPKLARGLVSFEVPTVLPSAATALRDEYAVKAFIALLEVGLGRRELTAGTAVEILTGPIGSLDAVSVRRLMSALRHQELAGGGDRSGRELLAESLKDPAWLATIDTRVARQAARVAASIAAIRSEAAEGATVEELLWGAWQRSGLEKRWYDQALATGIVAEEANRNLDAVVALFAAAKRFVERTPDYSAHNFLDEWTSADVPEDTLAPRAQASAVIVGTPAATVGRQYSIVVIAGLQENVWPNVRIRGTLLGANELSELLSGRSSPAGDSRQAVMHDELRMFAQAASRAVDELMVTAVADDTTLPSPFFRLVPQASGETIGPSAPVRSLHPLSLRGMVGRLRRELVTAQSPDAAVALARLAREGIPGAHPEQWYGLRPVSTLEPRRDIAGGEIVAVSPSHLHAFETCPLHWLIDQLGGGDSSLASNLGTVIHKVAEQATDPSAERLWSQIEAHWAELSFESEWHSEVQKVAARQVAVRLSSYLRDFEQAGGRLLDTELSFELAVGPALLRGTIDRVEQLASGALVIVDLKTGKHEPTSDAAVADHPQLSAYQLAFASGTIAGVEPGLPSAGAKLVILAKGTQKKPYYDPQQPPFGPAELEAFRLRVEEDAQGMAGNIFLARLGEHCLDPWSYGRCRIHVVRAVSS